MTPGELSSWVESRVARQGVGLFCSSGIQGAKPSRAVLPSTAGAAWWLWALGAFSDLRPLGSSPPPFQQLRAPLGSASLAVTSLVSGGGRVGGPSRRPPAIRRAQPHHRAPPLRPPLRARLFRARAGPRLFLAVRVARASLRLSFFHWSPRLAPPCKAAPELAGTRAPLPELPSPKGRDPVADSW